MQGTSPQSGNPLLCKCNTLHNSLSLILTAPHCRILDYLCLRYEDKVYFYVTKTNWREGIKAGKEM